MGVPDYPIEDFDGDEECVDIGGIVREVDMSNQTVTVVDATGDFTFHFEDSWTADVMTGDYVHIRGIPREAEDEYTIVGLKSNPLQKVSSWEYANPNFSDWSNSSLIKMWDRIGWLDYERNAHETRHGIEIYCLVKVNSPFKDDVLGCVPETYVFNWEVDSEVSEYQKFAGEVSISQLYQNAKTFEERK